MLRRAIGRLAVGGEVAVSPVSGIDVSELMASLGALGKPGDGLTMYALHADLRLRHGRMPGLL
jgi:hypothetical protein